MGAMAASWSPATEASSSESVSDVSESLEAAPEKSKLELLMVSRGGGPTSLDMLE